VRTATTRTIVGHVTAAGVCDRSNAPVSVQVSGTGVYVVRILGGLRLVGVVCNTDASGGVVVDTDSVTGDGWTARTYLSATGAANAWGFHFNAQVGA
jgi:hypothetical protein